MLERGDLKGRGEIFPQTCWRKIFREFLRMINVEVKFWIFLIRNLFRYINDKGKHHVGRYFLEKQLCRKIQYRKLFLFLTVFNF